MKDSKLIILSALAALIAIPLLTGSKPAKVTKAERVKRGEYLVSFGCCHDCHTPKKFGPNGPVEDSMRLLAGHPEETKLSPAPKLQPGSWVASCNDHLTAWSGPWGVSFAANLTPDNNTGLGIWTEEMFLKAMKTGKHMGSGRDILPPMPWQYVSKLNDDDLKAIYAYLRSIPAVKNRVPDPVPPAGKPTFE